jgi:hypothetical protein
MDTLREHLIKASKKQKEKYNSSDFSKWGKMSVEKRLGNMTKEEKTKYFRKIRSGQKVATK